MQTTSTTEEAISEQLLNVFSHFLLDLGKILNGFGWLSGGSGRLLRSFKRLSGDSEQLLGGSLAAFGQVWAAQGDPGRLVGSFCAGLMLFLGGSGWLWIWELLGGSWAAVGRLLGDSGQLWAV